MGQIFERTLSIIDENKRRIEEGGFNCIPFPFPRFSEVIPGIEQKKYSIITASSGVGKSKFAKYVYVINAFEFYRRHKGFVGLKILYFCLEESKEAFLSSIISYKLFIDHGYVVPSVDILSKRRALPDEIRKRIDELKEWFEEFEDRVDIIDYMRVPYQIEKYVETYAESAGTWSYREYEYQGELRKAKDYYTPNNPNEYVIVVIDHINLLNSESKLSFHETLTRFSAQYCVGLRDKYRYHIVVVQQQSAEKEKLEFNLFGGKNIDIKLEPSLDGLGDNKLTQRDADVVLGLFAPARYPMGEHRGYRIDLMGDSYRSLIVLKNREGLPNSRIGLHFLGAVGAFAEMPQSHLIMGVDTYDSIMRELKLFEAIKNG